MSEPTTDWTGVPKKTAGGTALVLMLGALVLAIAFAFIVTPRSSVDAPPDSTVRTPATQPVAPAEESPWPLTVTGKLDCHNDGPRKLVTLVTDRGIDYGLNGAARQFGFPDGLEMLKPGLTGADLQPLIARGLALCDK